MKQNESKQTLDAFRVVYKGNVYLPYPLITIMLKNVTIIHTVLISIMENFHNFPNEYFLHGYLI